MKTHLHDNKMNEVVLIQRYTGQFFMQGELELARVNTTLIQKFFYSIVPLGNLDLN